MYVYNERHLVLTLCRSLGLGLAALTYLYRKRKKLNYLIR